MPLIRTLFLFLACIFLLSCSDSPDQSSPPTPGEDIVALSINPIKTEMLVNTDKAFQAIAIKEDNTTEDITAFVTWQSNNTEVLIHDGEGVFSAQTQGQTTVTANFQEFTAQAEVDVVSADISQLVVLPALIEQAVGTNYQFQALAYLSDNTLVDITESVQWSSSAEEISSVSATGLVDFIALGSATISAAINNMEATGEAVVTNASLIELIVAPNIESVPVGVNAQFTATGVYSDGSSSDLTNSVVWQSSNSDLALIGNQGTAYTLASGSTEISAEQDGITSSAQLQITDAVVTTVQISPTNIQAFEDTSKQLKLLAEFSDGSVFEVSNIAQWQSDDTNIALVTTSGENAGFTYFKQAGSTQVQASFQGLASTAQVEVNAADLTDISISPANSETPVGVPVVFNATGIYSNGNIADITQDVVWQSSNTEVAVIDPQGVLQPIKAGETQVTASKNGISSSTTLTVTGSALVDIGIIPGAISLPIGAIESLQAVAYFDDGSSIDITGIGVWVSQSSSIAIVQPSGAGAGLIQGVTEGVSNISYSFDGQIKTITATITSATLTDLIISPTDSTIANGLTQQYSATGFYSDGSQQSLDEEVTWISSNADVANIDLFGLAQSNSVGSTTINASFSGLSTTAQLNVSDITISKIQTFPPLITAQVGSSGPLTAIALFSDNSTLDITDQVSWISSDDSIISVSNIDGNNGQAEALTQGNATVTANYEALSSSALAVISEVTLTSLVISPINELTTVGATVSYQATGIYSDGSSADLTSQVTWLSSNATIATISLEGIAQGLKSGITQISATLDSVSIQTNLEVTASPVISVVVSPASVNGPVGTSQQLLATAFFADGTNIDVTTQATWQTSDPAIATVTSNAADAGLLSLVGAGTTTINATFQAISGSVNITAFAVALNSIEIIPAQPTAPAGTVLQFSAIGSFSDNSRVDISDQVSWLSSDSSVAAINNLGLAYAQIAGSTTISAIADSSLGSIEAQTTLTVTAATITSVQILPGSFTQPVGVSGQLFAIAYFSDNSLVNVTEQATWTSSAPTTVQVETNNENAGFAQLLAEGSSSVSINYAGSTSAINITVTKADLVSIDITPINSVIAQGTNQQYQAVGTYSDGMAYPIDNAVTWSSSDNSIATISATGLANGIVTNSNATNLVEISASLDDISGATTLSVTPATVASIVITPATISQAIGSKQQFVATATLTDNSSQNITSLVDWSSGDPLLVSILTAGADTGLATMLGQGTTTVDASFNGISASANITVTAANLTSIEVTPQLVTLASGMQTQLVARGSYSDGSNDDITASVTWQSSDGNIVTVEPTGLVRGQSTGVATISATQNEVNGSANVAVINPELTSITITPTDFSGAIGVTQQLVAMASYSDGSTFDVTNNASWTSNDDAVTQINTTDNIGLVTLIGNGTATVSANFQGQIATSNIVVTGAELTGIQVKPFVSSIAAGLNQQYSVEGTYSDGSVLPISQGINWQSSANDIATIDPTTGLAMTVSPGTTTITATLDTFSADAALVVTNASIDSIEIIPASVNQPAGVSGQLEAIANLSDGTTFNVTANAQWQSSAPLVADIVSTGDDAGFVQLLTVGTSTIDVLFQGQTDSIAVNVTEATLNEIILSPVNKTTTQGSVVTFTATGVYSDGSNVDITNDVIWASSDESVATITTAGIATTLTSTDSSNRVTTISANFDGKEVDTSLTVTGATVVSLAINPAPVSLANGSTLQLGATATFSDNSTQNVTTAATWTILDPLVAQVISTGIDAGLTSALSAGTTTVTANYRGIEVTTDITVTDAKLESIQVTPFISTIPTGLAVEYTATGIYSDNTTQDLSSSVSWQSSTTAASIDEFGTATGIEPGTTVISATSTATPEVSGVASLTVNNASIASIAIIEGDISGPKGLIQQLHAIATLSDGSMIEVSSVATWTSSVDTNVSVVTTGLDGGLIELLSANTSADITVTLSELMGGFSDTVAVTVTAAELTQIQINPINETTAQGLTVAYTLTGIYNDGTTAPIASNTLWSSSDLSVATIEQTGVATAIINGSDQIQTTTIAAEHASLTTSTNLSVTDAPVASILVTPATATAAKGSYLRLSAMATFTDASQENVTSAATWSTSDNTVADVITTGENAGLVLMTGSTGSVTITATYQGQTSTSVITATAATLTSIEVSPELATVAKGTTQQYSAMGVYSDDSKAPLTEGLVWSTGDGAIATVDLNGLATAKAAGTTAITATVGTISSSADLVVTGAELVSLEVTPATNSGVIGEQVQLTATAHLSDATSFNVTNNVTWTSLAAGIADVSNTGESKGLVSLIANGEATVEASFDGKKASSNVVVGNAQLLGIIITPFASTIANGFDQQYAVTGLYSDGIPKPITTGITWQSDTPATATIDVDGLATSVAPGTTTITATVDTYAANATLTVTNATLTSVEIIQGDFSQPKGVYGQLIAIAHFSDNSTLEVTRNATWSTSDATIVDVVPSGVNAGFGLLRAEGSADVTVTLPTTPAQTDTITVTVTPATIRSLIVEPVDINLPEGLTEQYKATAIFSDFTSQDVTSLATWTSGDNAIATINATGLATAVSSGSGTEATTTITADYLNETAVTNLKVTNAVVLNIAITPVVGGYPVGVYNQFTATAYYSNNTSADITKDAVWSTLDDTIIQITPSGDDAGLALMVSEGVTDISASFDNKVDTISVTVNPVDLVSIQVEPTVNTLTLGLNEQYTAIGLFTDDTTEDITDFVNWSSDTTATATVTPTGLVETKAAGATNIIAQYTNLAGTSITNSGALTVTAPVVTGLQITPAIINEPIGFTEQLTATAVFSDNTLQNVTENATWESAESSIASVSATGVGAGVLTLHSEGTTTITATYIGPQGNIVNNTINVTVTSAVLTEILVSPSDATIPEGVTKQYTAIGIMSDGSNSEITNDVEWTSSNTTTAGINADTGLATALADGTTSITATFNTLSGNASLVVTNPILVSIDVTPTTATKLETQTQQFTAIGTYDNSDTANLTDVVTWTSDASAIATISNAVGTEGLATAIAEGAAQITAQYTPAGGNAITGTADFTVTGPAITEVIILPDVTSIVVGQQTQWTADAKDEFGNVFDITNDATWVSSVTATATVLAGNITGIYGGENDSDSQISNITVSYGGASDSADITVSQAATLAHNIYPSSQHLIVGTTGQVGAVIAYSDGNIRRATQAVTWASSDPSVATITSFNPNGGNITAVGVGSTNITYSFEGDESDYAATVNVEEITSPIQIFPNTDFNITDGSYYRMKAFATLSDGEQIDLWYSVGWGNIDNRTRFVPHNYSLEHQDPLFHQKEIHGIYRAGGDSGGQTGPKDIFSSLPYEDEDHEFASDIVTVTVTGKCPNMTYAGPGLFSGNGEGENPVDSLILSPMNATMALGEYLQLNLEVEKGGCVGNVTYGSASFAIKAGAPENVVSFDPEVGRLFAINSGTTTIVATYNQGQSVETTVTVGTEEVAFVRINPPGPTVINVGQSFSTLACGIRFMSNGVVDGGDVDITGTGIWSVDDNSIISLGVNDGTNQPINGVTAGTTFVRCTDPNGTKFGFHQVVVQEPVP